MSRFMMSTRNLLPGGGFGKEPGDGVVYLEVPAGEEPNAERHTVARSDWFKKVVALATRRVDEDGFAHGDVLVFVHGYSTHHENTLKRHDLLQQHMDAIGYKGAIVTFDWPSEDQALAYLEDRWDVQKTAHYLVAGGILPLREMTEMRHETKCDLEVHLVGHSSGAYVIREAFYQASKHRRLAQSDWGVSQVAFFGGDLGVSSMTADDKKSKLMYERCARITNYVNPHDIVLRLSNSKRLFMAPRIGRVGLPEDVPRTIYDVQIGPYWQTVNFEDNKAPGGHWHSFHFDDRTVLTDLFYLIVGHDDRTCIPGRHVVDGKIYLAVPPRL